MSLKHLSQAPRLPAPVQLGTVQEITLAFVSCGAEEEVRGHPRAWGSSGAVGTQKCLTVIPESVAGGGGVRQEGVRKSAGNSLGGGRGDAGMRTVQLGQLGYTDLHLAAINRLAQWEPCTRRQ